MAAVMEYFPRDEIIKTFRRMLGGVIARRLINETEKRFLKGRPLNQYNPTLLGLAGNVGMAFAKRQFEEQIPGEFSELLEDVRTSFDVIAGTHLDRILFEKEPYGFCVSNSEIKVYNLDVFPPTKVIVDGKELTAGTDYKTEDSKGAMTIKLATGKELVSGTREILVIGTTKAAYFTCYI